MTFRRARFPATALGAVAAIWLAGSGVAGIQTRPGRLGVGVSRGAPPASQSVATSPLGQALSDAEFWRLVETFSEPEGYFDSDNLLSNETTFQYVIPRLSRTVKPGLAYLGVGPEQNFAYIIALRPAIAFVPDIRRGNLQELLMYKALIEMASDRAEFLSLLFARPRPAGVGPATGVDALMDAYLRAPADEALYRRTLAAIRQWLTVHHGFALHREDFSGVEYVYSAFHAAGPTLSYNSSRPQRMRYPTYAELQRETDAAGQPRGYLASEANFRALKTFEERNLLVPLVGDFAGAKALRAVGAYLGGHGVPVGAFYTSNVENYLFQNGVWERFAGNVAALPIDASALFIRACFDRCQGAPGSRSTTLLDSMPGLMRDFNGGKIRTYWDVLARSN
jgi:hypothetical protein